MKKHYITAIVDLLLHGKEVDVVLANLKMVLENKGHQKLHLEILKGVAQALALQAKEDATSVVVARESDIAALQSAIADAVSKLEGSSDQVRISVDPTLIGGFTATRAGRLINRSYKEKLVSLYRSITK